MTAAQEWKKMTTYTQVACSRRVRTSLTRSVASIAIAVAGASVVVGCSSTPAIDGVWAASIGGTATINADGTCTGMYFDDGHLLDIGGPETCTLGAKASDGTYLLVVQQPPNVATYHVRFDGDTMSFDSGGADIVLKRQ